MHLVYFDESGNSGNNLNDPAQPVFALCAMLVEEKKWVSLEKGLEAVIDKFFPPPRLAGFEIHATEIRTARDPIFRAMSVTQRIALRDELMDVAHQHGIRLIARGVVKRKYQKWLQNTFGPGIIISPHVAAFALVARSVNDYLASLPGSPLGIFISDHNHEVVADVEKAIKVLRGATGSMKLCQIIEKGFFIDSVKSLPLQLCDLFAMSFRKMVERQERMTPKSVDDSGIEWVEKLIHRGPSVFADVIAWLTAQQNEAQKRSGQGH